MTSSAESIDPRSSIWDFLAYMLRFYREKHGLSLAQTAAILNISRQAVSHWEAGRNKPDIEHCRKLDQAWATGGVLELLHFYARTAHDPDWFGEYVRHEREATVVKVWGLSIVPGLFQTPGYARAMISTGLIDDTEAEEALTKRLARQEIFTRQKQPLVWLLLNWTAIEQPMGGLDVMREQLARLLELSERPNVALRVVPKSVGAHIGLDGPFMTLTVGDRDIGFAEAPIGGRLVLDPSEVRNLWIRYDRIGADALSRDETRTLIRQAMEGFQ